jgi:hypothetical protein
MQADIHIITKARTPALDYVLKFVFEDFFGLQYQVWTEHQKPPGSQNKISYGVRIEGVPMLGSNGYLFNEDLLQYETIKMGTWDELPVFFDVEEGIIPFDLFGAIFFHLARVEEYRNYEKDEHGRFSQNESFFNESKLLKEPIIDKWLMKFETVLQEYLPQIKVRERHFKWINTFDIDVAFAYRYRLPLRLMGGIAKDLYKGDFRRLKERFQVLVLGKKDPYDTYNLQLQSSEVSDETYHFFLVGGSTRFDNGLSTRSSGMRKLLKEVSGFSQIGLHPSYDSIVNQNLLTKEKTDLERSSGRPVVSSRQHFLRLEVPKTYKLLADEGIQVDYSMGFAESLGFRSGTTQKHFFFDVLRNEVLPIQVMPLSVMDGTLRDYLKLEYQEARSVLIELVNTVYDVRGNLVTLWHNDVLEDRSDNYWRKIFIEMTEHISKLKSKEI